jgi:hypothetical protein
MANTRQFKTRDSATAFMRKHGVTKEYYNNFLTTDTIGGKPIFVVDVDDMETFIDLKKSDEKHGTNCADGNYSKEDKDGNVTQGEYYNEDGTLKQDEKPMKKTEQPEKTSDLGKTELGKRLRERVEAGKKPTVVKERRKRFKPTKAEKAVNAGLATANARRKTLGIANAPATIGILKQYPDVPTKSIRATCMYLILEGLDNQTVFGAMKEIFGEETCKNKKGYPQYYRNELIKAKQLNEKGKVKK